MQAGCLSTILAKLGKGRQVYVHVGANIANAYAFPIQTLGNFKGP